MTIYFVSAPCGWRKMLGACDHMAERQYLSHHMYVAPSLELLNQTYDELKRRGLDPKRITSETHATSVKGAIVKFLKDVPDTGLTLCITGRPLWTSRISRSGTCGPSLLTRSRR